MAAKDLTPRELQVLRLYASGKSLEVAGKQLGISAGTVNNRLAVCAAKLGVKTRRLAVEKARQKGLL